SSYTAPPLPARLRRHRYRSAGGGKAPPAPVRLRRRRPARGAARGMKPPLKRGILVLGLGPQSERFLSEKELRPAMLGLLKKIFDPNPKERSEEHTSELQSRENLVCRLLLEKKR